MVLSFDQIKNMIIQNDYKSARIFQGHLDPTNLVGKPVFEKLNVDTNDLIIIRLEEIKTMYGGNYTIAFGDGNVNQNIRSMVKVQASFVKEIAGTLQPQNDQSFTHKDISTLTATIKDELKKEMQAEKDKAEVEEMKAELAQMKTMGGRGAVMIDALIQMWLTPENLNTVMQGTKPKNYDDYSKAELDEIEDACAKLIQTLGADIVIKLANKLQTPAGASMIPLVKNFANT